MTRYFSASTGGFYSDLVNGPRQIQAPQTERERKAGKRPAMIDNPHCTLPADAVPIEADRYDALMAAQAQGKQISVIGGKPVAIDRVPDPEAAAAARRASRDRKLANSDWTQLPDNALSPELRTAWAKYRQALRDLNMAENDWPTRPDEETAAP